MPSNVYAVIPVLNLNSEKQKKSWHGQTIISTHIHMYVHLTVFNHSIGRLCTTILKHLLPIELVLIK